MRTAERFTRVTESKIVSRMYESLKIDPNGKPINVLQEELRKKLSSEQKVASLKEILGTDDGSAVAKVLDIIFGAAYPNFVGRQCLKTVAVNKSPVKVPSSTKNIAVQLGQFGEIPIGEEMPAFTTVNIDLWGIRPAISKSMIEDEEFDIVQMQLAGAAKAMAEAENKKVIATIEAIGTPQAKTYATSQWATLTTGISYVEDDDFVPDVILCHPADKAKLLQDTTIASCLAYTGKALDGWPQEITIAGLKLKVCSDVTAGNYWIIDSSNLGALLLRRDITIDDFEEPKNDLSGAVFTSRFGVGIINKKACCKTATA